MNSGIFLILGTNQGDKIQNLAQVRAAIDPLLGTILHTSSVYQTAPWGKTDQADFYNQVVEVSSELDPHQLLEEVLLIETSLGRIRKEKWGSRIIDIDILFFGDQVIDTPSLTIPHPGIPQRKFTLVPLNEIAPQFVHPVIHKTVSTLFKECSDKLEVMKIQR
jgi:2-amino-4-hydroxy-6-hydroxymethyldihydropteridine diphosphokinase